MAFYRSSLISFVAWWEYERLKKWADAAEKLQALIVGEGSIVQPQEYLLFEEITLSRNYLYVRMLAIVNENNFARQLTADYSPLAGVEFWKQRKSSPTRRVWHSNNLALLQKICLLCRWCARMKMYRVLG